jgi:hypothetical protein
MVNWVVFPIVAVAAVALVVGSRREAGPRLSGQSLWNPSKTL